jgi:hypothetical protein
MSDSSPSASTSNTTSAAGVVSASMFTRDAAGWMRWESSSKSSRALPPDPVLLVELVSVVEPALLVELVETPDGRAMTISPSTTQRSGSASRTAATTSGK